MDDGTCVPEDCAEFGEWVDSQLYSVLQSTREYSWMVHFDTRITFDEFGGNDDDEVVSSLFDTGALCANYVSRSIYEKVKKNLKRENIIMRKTRIGLAGAATTTSNTVVILDLEFQGPDGHWLPYCGEFIVLEMEGNDIIIGLPAIVSGLWSFFTETVAARSTREGRLHSLSLMAEGVSLPDPWGGKRDTEAPEEVATPDPVQFEFAHAFLGKPREEALREYYAMFDSHIDPTLAAATPVVELLRGKAEAVFVPDNWDGISGVPELTLNFKGDMPERHKPPTRHVNPRLFEAAEKEFTRLCGYFYEPSRSPWASPIVLAPKATKPFIRYCGDYSWLNKFMDIQHYPIPNVRHELDKIINYPYYIDIDLTNAFHQIRLAEDTRQYLSVQTPWGQFEPKFMPEGIGPGSFVLQETVRRIFADFSDWAIIIFDNVLILANDHDDAYQKLDRFIDRCIEHNVKLKFAKSWIGLTKVNFFGYACQFKSHELTEDRKKAILEIPFPDTGNRCKKMRSALGIGVFCAPFIKNYKGVVKHLTDCTKTTFDWDESTWTHDYRAEFEEFKLGIQQSVALFYPDYDLDWVLRTDACEYGVGGVLMQVKVDSNGAKEEQIIAVCSSKFSPQACKWATIEQEGYGIFYCVKKFAYYLRGKHFGLETDHRNLLWMVASEVPKIVRWRIYLQSFDFEIRHIKGRDNTVADALSRLLLLSCVWNCNFDDPANDNTLLQLLVTSERDDDSAENYLNAVFGEAIEDLDPDAPEIKPEETVLLSPEDIFSQVHNSQTGHWGAAKTWKLMNKLAPGHGLSQAQVAELVAHCANCQKTRRSRKNNLIPVVRHLKPPRARTAIGIDTVYVTPAGENGVQYIIVVVNLFTKHTALYPTNAVTAINLAHAVWKHWCNFGHTDMIVSDKGSDLSSKLMEELVKLMGMRHVFSITDRHINGTERVIGEVVRHLRAIVYDKRLPNVFDEPTVLPSVQYILNDHLSHETGEISPFELTFGTQDAVYKDLLRDAKVEPTHALLRALNDNLKVIREASVRYVLELIRERSKGQVLSKFNSYQPGDWVLFDRGPKCHPKMSTRLRGPFEVVQQFKNDVQVRNIVTGAITEFSVSDLEPFFGDRDTALDAARRDHDQHEVDCILSYRGNHDERTNLQFTVRFMDGDVVELTYTPDLRCEALMNFCDARRYLKHMTFDSKLAQRWISSKKKEDIRMRPGQTVFVDIRVFGGRWYESLELPDWRNTSYVMEFEYLCWEKDKLWKRTGIPTLEDEYTGSRKQIRGRYSLGGAQDVMNSYKVWCFGEDTRFDPNTMVLVDDAMAAHYPRILED